MLSLFVDQWVMVFISNCLENFYIEHQTKTVISVKLLNIIKPNSIAAIKTDSTKQEPSN